VSVLTRRPSSTRSTNPRIVAGAFAGQSRVARQRAIYAILAEELAGPVHALQLSALTPEEAAASAPQ